MECHSIPSTGLPHTTLLYNTYLSDFPRLTEYYAHPPTMEGIIEAAGEVRIESSLRRSVVEVLRKQNQGFGGDEAIERNLDRLVDGAVAIVTGQQVGLLGGPAFSVYKALTAIRIARELTAIGTIAVPVFWLATEDHDLAEIDHCFFAARGGLDRFDLIPSGLENRRVGEIRLGEAVSALAARADQILEGAAAADVSKWISESYRPEQTFGSAFAKLMMQIFAGRGLVLLDPLAPELHRLSAPTVRRALEEHHVLAKDLVARSTVLETAGYHAQVKVVEQSTLVFRIVDGQRLAIRSQNGGFISGGKAESTGEILKALAEHPEEFSASALLRPIVQDTLLPTAAYIAGPAEVAYYAQASVAHQRLLGRSPAILPRAGFTLVSPHVVNLLKKYKVDVRDVFAGRQQLRAKLEAEVLPKTLSQRFAEGEKGLQHIMEDLREPLATLDQTLVGSLDNAVEKMLYQFNSLRGKAGRAEGFRTGVLDTHEREMTSLLMPNHQLQERSLSLLPFFATEGRELLDHLDGHIKIGTGEHCVLYL